jgi:hypothetical protein
MFWLSVLEWEVSPWFNIESSSVDLGFRNWLLHKKSSPYVRGSVSGGRGDMVRVKYELPESESDTAPLSHGKGPLIGS